MTLPNLETAEKERTLGTVLQAIGALSDSDLEKTATELGVVATSRPALRATLIKAARIGFRKDPARLLQFEKTLDGTARTRLESRMARASSAR